MVYDPFLPIIDFESPDDLHLAIANLFFPIEELGFKPVETRLMKKKRLSKGIKLMDEGDLKLYSDKAFKYYIEMQKPKPILFTEEEKKHLSLPFEQWETKIVVSGEIGLRAGYGIVAKNENLSIPPGGIFDGFNMSQSMKVNLVGKIGERVQVNINHDSSNPENEYEISYKALEKDEGVVRELRAGNISLNIPQSSYFVKYNGSSKDNYGIKGVFQTGDLSLQAVLSITKSQKGYKKYVGKKKMDKIEVQDVSYVKRKYYLLPDTGIDRGSVELLQSTSITNIADRQIDSHFFIRLIEGRDYYVNNDTGELNLTNTLDRNLSLVVRYTKGGNIFTTNSSSIVGVDNNTGELFLYLWKSSSNFSQYIHYGYYQLPYTGFDPTKGFSLTVVYSSDKSKLADFQFSPFDYILSTVKGTIQFKNKLPFPDPYGSIYSNANDPSSQDSQYTMIITLYNEVSSYQLDFGIIPGTERVYLNGRLLSPSEYTIVYSLGELIFNYSTLINENDTIEVYYEYKPFWSGAQSFSIASRLDYKPSSIFSIGNTTVYNASQHGEGAPHISATPDGTFMSDIDGTINFARLFGLPSDLDFSVKGEYALSVYDPNNVDYAIVEDFESTGESFSFSKTENWWILSAPVPTNIIDGMYYTNRGKLLYKDYRSYNLDGSFTLLNFNASLPSERIKDYSFKPGPYQALGGHLSASEYPDISQTSLIFDFDFRSGGEWVGAAMPIAGASGVNLSEFNQINIWAYLQSDEDGDNIYSDDGTASVDLYVVVGNFNEDSDGNGILDGEVDQAQPGYDFHNYINKNIVETKVGRGRLGEGDGYIQSEDLNKDGVLQTNSEIIIFPGASSYSDNTNTTLNGGSWRKITINLKTFSPEQIAILQHATALGVYVKKKNGNKGRVIIDTLEFKKINWYEKRIDEMLISDSKVFQSEILSVFNNPYYSANRFYVPDSSDKGTQDRAEVFEKLHGSRSVSEARQYDEKALSLNYNLSNVPYDTNTIMGGGKSAKIIKRNTVSYNISQYKLFNYYIYIPDRDENGTILKTTGDTYTNEEFFLIMGNSENSYYKWRIPLDSVSKNSWHSISIEISEGLSLKVDGQSIPSYEKPVSYGVPNLIDVNFIAFGIDVTSTNEPVNRGIIWVNEVYTHSDITRLGTAYYVNPILEYKKPLLAFNETEILGPFSLKTTYENRDYNFIGSEGAKPGNYGEVFNIFYSSSLLKEISYSFTIGENNQGTTTNELEMPIYLQWKNRKWMYNHSIMYSGRYMIPIITHSYTESFEDKLSRSLINVSSNDSILGIYESQFNSAARIDLNQNYTIFENFTVGPKISFEDSFYLIDKSNFTNEEEHCYLTNSSVYGIKGLKKSFGSGLGFSIYFLNISGDYSHSEDKYKKVNDEMGFRQEIGNLRSYSLWDRYTMRLKSISEGFNFPEEDRNKENSDSYGIQLGIVKPLPFFSLNFNDRITRNALEYNYNDNGTLYSSLERYILLSDNKLSLYPKFIIDTFIFRVKRNLEIGYYSVTNSIGYSDIFDSFGQVYYYEPFHYSPYFSGNYGRTNSLEMVKEYSIAQPNSTISFSDLIEIEMTLPEFKNFLDLFLPKRYKFYTLLNTARTLSSYSQGFENQFDLTFPLKISKWGISFLESGKDLRVGDINIEFSLKNNVNYNDRKITDTITLGVNQTYYFSTNANLFLRYSLSTLSESYIKNVEDFEHLYGFSVGATNLSPLQKQTHVIETIYNWVWSIKELDLLLFKIKLSGYNINNKEGILLTMDAIDYQGYKFIQYIQKIYELTLSHETVYQFTDYVKGGLILKGVVNQYAQITPLADSRQITYFKPGFGFQFSFDLRIVF